MMKKLFCADLGNGYTKLRTEKGLYVAPSAYIPRGKVNVDIRGELIGDVYSVNGQEYVWGERIKERKSHLGDLIAAYGTGTRRYTLKPFRTFAMIALAAMASQYEEYIVDDVVVVTGAPTADVKAVKPVLKELFMGSHVVNKNGIEQIVKVVDVKVLEQPLGTIINQYMDDGFDFAAESEGTVTVVDFGTGTTLINTYNNLELLEKYSRTFPSGMGAIYNMIASKQSNCAPELVERAIKGDNVLRISAHDVRPIGDDVSGAVDEFVDKLVADIELHVDNASTDVYLLTGGGAAIVGEAFMEAYGSPSMVIVEDSQTANINGYYKWGQGALALEDILAAEAEAAAGK
jgi:plasmid segregation protein ParM